MILQQGDVIIEGIEKLPEGLKKKKATKKGYVLAEGEITGHAHCIKEIGGIEFYEKDGNLYLINNKKKDIVHEEHSTVTLPPGKWKIRKVREYDHFKEEAREVRD